MFVTILSCMTIILYFEIETIIYTDCYRVATIILIIIVLENNTLSVLYKQSINTMY